MLSLVSRHKYVLVESLGALMPDEIRHITLANSFQYRLDKSNGAGGNSLDRIKRRIHECPKVCKIQVELLKISDNPIGSATDNQALEVSKV